MGAWVRCCSRVRSSVMQPQRKPIQVVHVFIPNVISKKLITMNKYTTIICITIIVLSELYFNGGWDSSILFIFYGIWKIIKSNYTQRP